MLIVNLIYSVNSKRKFDNNNRFVQYNVAIKGNQYDQFVNSEKSKDVTHKLKNILIEILIYLTTLLVDRVFVNSKVL